ncbi:MAG: hypothetical protein PHO31_01350 [Candidatus Pacebacteria bacterium]|nr:hypothetical protein [Candidatus Paceibacterota bacterium]
MQENNFNSEEKLIGRVTHFFPHTMAAIVKLEDDVNLGDRVKFQKGENQFEQEIKSMQVDHQPIQFGKKGDEVAIQTEQKVKEGYLVFKIE